MIILGIESSCDETSAAVLQVNRGKFLALSNIVSSQIEIHKEYGGVVPEVAARNHIKNIIPVIKQALEKAKITPKQIDRIAVTAGPGLITSLMVGVQTAKTLAYSWNKPIVPVNHLKGHLYSAYLENQNIKFPLLALIVSGGHTELVLMKSKNQMKKIGQTVDDAAGEAFDKVAKILKLGYPGGPEIAKLAESRGTLDGSQNLFPRPMINSGDFNFSFSGLKTAVLYKTQEIKKLDKKNKINIAAEFQQAAVDVLIAKTMKAVEKYKIKTLILTGGVAANKELRKQLQEIVETRFIASKKISLIIPPMNLCTDNALMIAAASYFEKPVDWKKITVDPNLEIR